MASSYLHRTNSSGSGTTATISMWVKQNTSTLTGAADGGLFTFYTASTDYITAYSNPTVKFRTNIGSGTTQGDKATLINNSDPAAWYHYVFVIDTTNGTPGDRMRIWINGVRVTDAQLNTDIDPSSSYSFTPLVSGIFQLNKYGTTTAYSNNEYSHVHYTDGYAYDASTFGSFDSTSGIWKIKTGPSVTYGTNGFFLKFEDRTNLDLDSGTNTFTDFTTVGTLTATYDNPSNNFATLNPLNQPTSTKVVFSNGNNTAVSQSASGKYFGGTSTLGMVGGKWYCEFKSSNLGGDGMVGINGMPGEQARQNQQVAYTTSGFAYLNSGEKKTDLTTTSYGNSYDTSNVIGIAVDLDNLKIYFAKDNTWQDSGDPTSGATGTGAAFTILAASATPYGHYAFSCADNSSGATTWDVNFGNGYFGTTAVTSAEADGDGIGAFEFAPPTGYYALCTKNIKAYGG